MENEDHPLEIGGSPDSPRHFQTKKSNYAMEITIFRRRNQLMPWKLQFVASKIVLDDRRQKMLDPVSMLRVNHRETRKLALFPTISPMDLLEAPWPNRGRSNLAKHAQC